MASKRPAQHCSSSGEGATSSSRRFTFMATSAAAAAGSMAPAVQMASQPCRRKRCNNCSALASSPGRSLRNSEAAKRSTKSRRARKEPPSDLAPESLSASSASFVACLHISSAARWIRFLPASSFDRSFCVSSIQAYSSSSPSSRALLFLLIFRNSLSSSESSDSLLSSPPLLFTTSLVMSVFSQTLLLPTSPTPPIDLLLQSSSLGSERTRTSFISWRSWKWSELPPLSGWSSSAFFLKARRINAWSWVWGIPSTAHAARFFSVLRRPLALLCHSSNDRISSRSSSLSICCIRLRSRCSLRQSSSMSLWGATGPSFSSRKERSTALRIALPVCASYARHCSACTPKTRPNSGSIRRPGPKNTRALAVSALPCQSSWSNDWLPRPAACVTSSCRTRGRCNMASASLASSSNSSSILPRISARLGIVTSCGTSSPGSLGPISAAMVMPARRCSLSGPSLA
mmetsp:Transcript_74097/g.239586  ORF Transcript_74097/g.239586 Transcript_74097/m.239586 type:complete len:459 (+) Transcript_74097:695-2071(+)